jgi:hypothetical protein
MISCSPRRLPPLAAGPLGLHAASQRSMRSTTFDGSRSRERDRLDDIHACVAPLSRAAAASSVGMGIDHVAVIDGSRPGESARHARHVRQFGLHRRCRTPTFCVERSAGLFAADATALVSESGLFIAGHRYGCFGPSTGGSDLT